MEKDTIHERLLAIVLRLPEAEESWPWGSIHCKVLGKIFVGWSRGSDGLMSIGVRTTLARQAKLVETDKRVSIAKYVGKYGGIDVCIGAKPDWDEVETFITESYRLIAPKRLVAKLGGSAAPTRSSGKATKASATAKGSKSAVAKALKAGSKPATKRKAAAR